MERGSWTSWLRRRFGGGEPGARGLDEEIQFHVDMHARRLEADGVAPDEARRRALVAFGGRERFKEEVRDARGGRWLEDLARDLRFAARGLRRTPGFTVAAVLSLGLGIGANTAAFSAVRAVLLRPLPFPAADRLVNVGVRDDGEAQASSLSDADALALAASPAFEAFGAYAPAMGGVTLTGQGEPTRLAATQATSGVFRALGTPAHLGRALQPADDAEDAPRVAVLSHAAWRERFGASPGVVGSTLVLDGEAHVVVGVMPPGFRIPGQPAGDLWTALRLGTPRWRAPFWLLGVGRLTPAAAAGGAAAELAAVADDVKRRFPDSPPQWRYESRELRAWVVRGVRPTLLAMYGAVALVLLMAVTNVANLTLTRATTRAAELAVRTALGAGRRRLVRQLLTESLLVALLGGLLGLALGVAGVRVLALLPDDLPRGDEVSLDWLVLVVALGVTLLAGLATGLAPALQAPHRRLALGLREGARTGPTGATRRLRESLVVAEFALALTVLVGAALCVGSLRELQRVDAGVASEGVLVARVTLPRATFPEEAQLEQYLVRLTERAAALPGVAAASVAMGVPPDRLVMSNPYTPQGAVLGPGERAPVAEELLVGPDYFRTLGIPLLAGRAFTDADRGEAPPVAIVNETLARRHFPNGDALGRWLQTGDPNPDAPKLAIVGIVPDVKYVGLDADPAPTIYVPYRQHLWWRSMYVVVRRRCAPSGEACDAAALAAPLRAAAAEADARVPLQDVRTMDALLSDSVAAPRFRAGLLAAFGLVALALAGTGIYGVVSYGVTQRRRETALRLALGASPGHVVRQVVGGGVRLALVGVALGVPLALAGARLLRELLYGVSPVDPASYALAAAFLALLGVAACLVPARRATRAEPSAVLRAE